ncbi:hypothetical protein C8R43DRAFT_1238195 [Mycena crocata]|nr:hypothetical protein C8R43DRAFT_1238195 [Mycena crocata]
MLAFPQPTNSELVEGCPLVHMHDNPAEVTVFLKAIFDSEFFETYPSKTHMNTVTGVLRLGHKYGVDYLKRRALVHLSSICVTAIDKLDTWMAQRHPSGITNDPPFWIQTIQVAREVNASWILPIAFYSLADTCFTKADTNGGLVVQAENSLYRVSGGILGARSPVYKDMLSFPQPRDAETIEGCPVVRLPDSAVDVTCFFRAIFDSSFFEPYPAKTSLEIVISILRLSNKYSVDFLRRRALVHLSSCYPTTLSEYSKLHRLSSINGPTTPSAHNAALRISREVNALWILPTIFYFLAGEDDHITEVLNTASYEERPAKLSTDDQILFLKTNFKILRGAKAFLYPFHSPESIPGCLSSWKCAAARLHAVDNVQAFFDGPIGSEPLDMPFVQYIWDPLKKSCCEVCYIFLGDEHTKARQSFWDNLPSFCDLPPWKELEEMKAEALQA